MERLSQSHITNSIYHSGYSKSLRPTLVYINRLFLAFYAESVGGIHVRVYILVHTVKYGFSDLQ